MTRAGRRLVSAAILCCLIGLSLVVATPAIADEDRFTPREDILIRSDAEFDEAHGIVGGSGTPRDPYVISGWEVRRIHIADTSRALVIRDNSITSQLVLNWNGPNVTVVRNRIGDLRVNQNVRRTGAATSGLIAQNSIRVVGQLRHFDGIFEHNVVRPGNNLFDPFFGGVEAVQFDGFNGAIFRNNALYGALDVKLHGHHHGSGFGATSHDHSHGAEQDHEMDDMDHTKRYHEVFVYGNTIHSTGNYALRWTDTNHRGDDRTAASEQNEALNAPHTHWTRVHLFENRLIGSGLYVDIFNAEDEKHLSTNRGLVHIADNVITLDRADTEALFEYRHGIQVWNARDLDLRITGNTIASEIDENVATQTWERTVGIFLEDLDVADVRVANNEVSSTYYGVRASYFTDSVHWWVSNLTTDGVEEDVYYDQSVSNPPGQGP